MAAEGSRMKVTINDGLTIVTLADQRILDEVSIAKIGDEIESLIKDQLSPRLIIDFTNVTNMSSSALGMLITVHKRIREKNGTLVLCHIQPAIAEIFKITRLDEIFTISTTVDVASEVAQL